MDRLVITEVGSGANSVTGLAAGVRPQLVSDLAGAGWAACPRCRLLCLTLCIEGTPSGWHWPLRGCQVRRGLPASAGDARAPARSGSRCSQQRRPLAAVPGGSPGQARLRAPVPAPQAHRGDSGAADTWPQPQLCHIDGAPAPAMSHRWGSAGMHASVPAAAGAQPDGVPSMQSVKRSSRRRGHAARPAPARSDTS